ncbi:MAG: tRNA glutamyl-Q(34) synthetase GluQRS [Myxococcales bacterium]|nr:tRNA glutamyl-Q(34) synthetase GluQRS [Myxococcales bacterium]
MPTVVGRLAPTPSGHLHLGNVVAFAAAWLSVRQQGGTLLLRFEDVDTQRAQLDVEASIRQDLEWLGLQWDTEVPAQRHRDYGPWLKRVAGRSYRCTCTRREIREQGGIYPGTCRRARNTEGAVRFWLPDTLVTVEDRRFGPRDVVPSELGDPVLRRRDGTYAYNLAVVADDIADGVTEVVRGADLLELSAVQMVLWEAMGADPPTWMHVPLVLGPDGRKLSKSHGSTEVRALRQADWAPEDVWRAVLPWLGLHRLDHVQQAVEAFRPERGPRGPIALDDDLTSPRSQSPT